MKAVSAIVLTCLLSTAVLAEVTVSPHQGDAPFTEVERGFLHDIDASACKCLAELGTITSAQRPLCRSYVDSYVSQCSDFGGRLLAECTSNTRMIVAACTPCNEHTCLGALEPWLRQIRRIRNDFQSQ